LDLAGLRSLDPERRRRAWEELESLASRSPKELEDKRLYIRSLLWHKMQGVREEAWKHLPLYKRLEVNVERAFRANSDRIKLTAWSHYPDVISSGLMTREQVVKMRQHFWRLLRSFYPTVRKKAWALLVSMVRDGIVQEGDKEKVLSYLSHRKVSVRLLAWSKVRELGELGFLTREDVERKEAFLKELTQGESRASARARKLVEVLRL